MALYLPSSLNLEEVIGRCPPVEIINFKIDKLVYIIDLITLIPVSNRKIEIKDGSIPISARSLQKKVPDYRKYLDYLVRIGIIECDNHYIPKKKSLGYRFTEDYQGKLSMYRSSIELRKNSILHHHKKRTGLALETYPYLMKWFNKSLVIDYESAQSRLNYLLENYSPPGETKEIRERNYYSFHNSHYRSITDFYIQDFRAVIDEFGFRLHTNLTNISKEYRSFITYDGEKLVSIDVGSSQPYLSTILLNEQNYLTDRQGSVNIDTFDQILTTSDDSYNKHHTIRGGASASCLHVVSPLMVQSFKVVLNSDDISMYRSLVTEGLIYDYFADRVQDELGQDFVSSLNLDLTLRKHRKQLFFMAVYSHNSFIHQKEAAHIRLFQQEFPSVHKIFHEIKKTEKNNLVMCLQRWESHLVLNAICKRFAEQFPDIPLYTIHDSMITIQSHCQYLTEIAESVLTDVTGIKPRLKREDWEEKLPTLISIPEHVISL